MKPRSYLLITLSFAFAPNLCLSQGIFSIPPYELTIEQVRDASSPWTFSKAKGLALLAGDVDRFYHKNVKPSGDYREQLADSLTLKRARVLSTNYVLETWKPVFAAGRDRDYEDYSITTDGFNVDVPVDFPQVPKREQNFGYGIKWEVLYVDNPSERTKAFEENRDSYNFLWVFRIADNPTALTAAQLRLMIYNKFTEEVAYDHVFP